MAPAPAGDVEPLAESLLGCPQCHGRIELADLEIRCRRCGPVGRIDGGVVRMGGARETSFFDDRHQVMERGNESEGVRCLCYAQQARFIAQELAPGMVVLDVGCGPALLYSPPPGCVVIGLDPSLGSVRRNTAVHLRVHGTATSLPLPSRSLDAILCFYSVHHMVGRTRRETRATVQAALREFARTLRAGRHLFIFEVRPWWPVWMIEQGVWNLARRVLGPRLDMHFWSARALAALTHEAFPGRRVQMITFRVRAFTTFPPAFSLPWLRIPRFLYPFDATLYHLVA